MRPTAPTTFFALLTAGALLLTGATESDSSFGELWQVARSSSIATKRAALTIKSSELEATLFEKTDDPALAATAAIATRYRENPPAGITERTDEDQSYGLRLTWPVYDFGRTSAARERLAQERRVAELSAAAVDEALYWQLARAYQTAAHTERLVAATLEQVTFSEQRLKEQRRNYQQGLRPESDLVAAEVDLAALASTMPTPWPPLAPQPSGSANSSKVMRPASAKRA